MAVSVIDGNRWTFTGLIFDGRFFNMNLLEKALRDYDGAILCVSHDEAFCRAIALEREICL